VERLAVDLCHTLTCRRRQSGRCGGWGHALKSVQHGFEDRVVYGESRYQ
jgi:hypothetical protein